MENTEPRGVSIHRELSPKKQERGGNPLNTGTSEEGDRQVAGKWQDGRHDGVRESVSDVVVLRQWTGRGGTPQKGVQSADGEWERVQERRGPGGNPGPEERRDSGSNANPGATWAYTSS